MVTVIQCTWYNGQAKCHAVTTKRQQSGERQQFVRIVSASSTESFVRQPKSLTTGLQLEERKIGRKKTNRMWTDLYPISVFVQHIAFVVKVVCVCARARVCARAGVRASALSNDRSATRYAHNDYATIFIYHQFCLNHIHFNPFNKGAQNIVDCFSSLFSPFLSCATFSLSPLTWKGEEENEKKKRKKRGEEEKVEKKKKSRRRVDTSWVHTPPAEG